MQYKYAILGGTFDRFHAGHKALIHAACTQSEKVDIGITTEKFYTNKHLAHLIEPYDVRMQSVKEYVEKEGFGKKVAFVQLEDINGNALKKREIEAIFVTKDTEANAKIINQNRLEQGFPKMEIIVIPFVTCQDGSPLTAERIRRGEIDRNGIVYKNLFKNTLQLPIALREELRKPIGEITSSVKEIVKTNDIVVTVGDIVTLSVLDAGITPSVSIIDLKTQRQKLDEKELQEKLDLTQDKQINNPGTINKDAVHGVQQKINQFLQTKRPQVLLIDGEEDLLTLPVILLAPLETKVMYGQVGQGAVIVQVTEIMKEKIKNLLNQFNKNFDNISM